MNIVKLLEVLFSRNKTTNTTKNVPRQLKKTNLSPTPLGCYIWKKYDELFLLQSTRYHQMMTGKKIPVEQYKNEKESSSIRKIVFMIHNWKVAYLM